MQLGIYDDDTYKSDATGVSGERSFVRFMTSLRPHVDRLIVAGRLDPEPGRSHYPLGVGVEFVGLPYYTSLTHPLQVLRSLTGSARRFWRMLDRVNTVWLLGPYIHAIGFALLALIRRRRVVLGVRQDLPRYVRSRHPNAPWVHGAADILEMAFRTLARWLPVAVVGPDLAERYSHARRLLELTVSLVSAADVIDESEALSSNRCAGTTRAQRGPARSREESAAACRGDGGAARVRLRVAAGHRRRWTAPRTDRGTHRGVRAQRGDRRSRLRSDRWRAPVALRIQRRLSARLVDRGRPAGAVRGVRRRAAGRRNRCWRCGAGGRRRGAPGCTRRCPGGRKGARARRRGCVSAP